MDHDLQLELVVIVHRCLNGRAPQYLAVHFTLSHCPARDVLFWSSKFARAMSLDCTHMAAGLLPLLVRPPETVFRTLSSTRTSTKLLSGSWWRHFCSHGASTSCALWGFAGDVLYKSTFWHQHWCWLCRYDHLRKEASDAKPAKVDRTAEPWRAALESAFTDYVHNYYNKLGSVTVYGSSTADGSVTLTACIESHQFSPKNFWYVSHRFRSIIITLMS